MGTNPYGKVFYGFALVDEDGEAIEPEGPWEQNDLYSGWEEFYIEKQGGLPRPDSQDYRGPEWSEWRAKRKALMDSCPADVVLVGSEYNLISCIVIRDSYAQAEWSEIKPLKATGTKPDWDQQLRDWCELMGIEWREPGWYVASLYF
jgi:hypothetical protein